MSINEKYFLRKANNKNLVKFYETNLSLVQNNFLFLFFILKLFFELKTVFLNQVIFYFFIVGKKTKI